MTAVEVPLTQGYVAVVDAADAGRVLSCKWYAHRSGRTVYASRQVRNADGSWTTQKLHQFLTGYEQTDHRNGNGLDNRRSNLRDATAGGNPQNTRRRVDSTSGFKGVSWHKGRRKWRAYIAVGGQSPRHLGYYLTAEEAALAYDAAARGLHGAYASVNFPLPGERAA